MLNRLTRTYAVAALIFVFILSTVQLLRYSSANSSRRPSAASSGWRDWMWPAEGQLDWSDAGMIGQKEGSSEESGTSASEGAHHKPLVPVAGSDAGTAPGNGPDWLGEMQKHSSSAHPHTTPVKGKGHAAKATVTVTVEKTVEKTVEVKPSTTCAPATAWTAAPLPAVNTTFHVPHDIKYDPAGPRPDQIVVVTASDGKGHNGGIPDILARTAENRKEYCAHHGYHYHFVNISKFDMPEAHPVWKKIPAIVDAFNAYPEAQWVFFLDLDAIIMSPKQDLNSLVLSHKGMKSALNLGTQYSVADWAGLGVWMPNEPDYANIDMLVAQDHNGINAGSFFLRRSSYTQWLLDMWADPFFMRMDWPGQEQDTLLHFVKHHHTFRSHLGLLKQRVANAFPEGGDQMRWMEGDLVVHLAGCWVADKCRERFEEFWDKRGRL